MIVTGTRTQRDYTLALKLAVSARWKMARSKLNRRDGGWVQGRSAVLVWLRKHERKDGGRLQGCVNRRSDPLANPINR